MTTTEVLVNTPPNPNHGIQIGTTPLQFSVEILFSEEADSLWDTADWDVDAWSRPSWIDLTEYVRGLEWSRGADEPYGRPRVGMGTITLDSEDDRFSPMNNEYPFAGSSALFGPGSLIRWGFIDDGYSAPYPETPTLKTGFESDWNDFYMNGTISTDVAVRKEGLASLRYDLAASGITGASHVFAAPFDASETAWRFFVRSDAWADINVVEMLVSTSGNFAEFFASSFSYELNAQDDDWVEVVLTPAQFINYTGMADWTTANRVIFRTSSVGTTTPTLWIDGLDTFPLTPAEGRVSIVFDDGWDSMMTYALPYMDTNGMAGTAYIIPEGLGSGGFIDQADVDTLADAGWDISGHNVTDLSTLSLADARNAVKATRDYLEQYKYQGRDHYAYPNGGHSEEIREIVGDYFSTGRTINRTANSPSYTSEYQMASYQVYASKTLTNVTDAIDAAMANGEWLILGFHDLVPGTPVSNIEWNVADFEDVIDYLVTNSIDVRPVSSIWEEMKPRQWYPQFTGIVDGWDQTDVEGRTDSFVNVTLVETMRDVATVDENALIAVAGSGDTVIQRVDRLLTAADWLYGQSVKTNFLTVEPGALQSTDMAENRLTELYLAADSGGAEIYSGRNGQAVLDARWEEGRSTTSERFSVDLLGDQQFGLGREEVEDQGFVCLSYNADEYVATNNDEHIVNDARLARVGGSQQVYEHTASINRYGRRSLAVSNLVNTTSTPVLQRATDVVNRRGRSTLQIADVGVYARRSELATYLMASAEVGDRVMFFPPRTEPTAPPLEESAIEFVVGQTAQGFTNSLTSPAMVGTAAGDVVVAFVTTNNSTTVPVPGSGSWSTLGSESNANYRVGVYATTLTGALGSMSWTTASSHWMSVFLVAYRGASLPLGVDTAQGFGASINSVLAGSVGTNDRVLHFGHGQAGGPGAYGTGTSRAKITAATAGGEVIETVATTQTYTNTGSANMLSGAVLLRPISNVFTAPVRVAGLIRNMDHKVTPLNGSDVEWDVTISLDTVEVYNLLGAQLPL